MGLQVLLHLVVVDRDWSKEVKKWTILESVKGCLRVTFVGLVNVDDELVRVLFVHARRGEFPSEERERIRDLP